MPRHALEFFAELLWSLWAWPAIEAQGDWPFFLFAALCCVGGVALGGTMVASHRILPGMFGATLAAGAGWGLVCLARVGWLSL